MRSFLWLLLGGMATATMAAEIKCYVELEEGSLVILQGVVQEEDTARIKAIFAKKGYETDGGVKMVTKVLECVPAASMFASKAAQKQEQTQLR